MANNSSNSNANAASNSKSNAKSKGRNPINIHMPREEAEALSEALRYLLDGNSQYKSNSFIKAVYAKLVTTFDVEDNKVNQTENWDDVKAHFDVVFENYKNQLGIPGTQTAIALGIVLSPLLQRYNSGERSRELYEKMRDVA